MKRQWPSYASLLQMRKAMHSILEVLQEAYRKSRDVSERAAILFQTEQVKKRIELMERTIESVNRLRKRKQRVEDTLAAIEARLKKSIARQCNAAGRWLRRWERT